MHFFDSETSLIFGIQMELQDFKERFRDLLIGKPHQKFLKRRSREVEIDLGRRKELIA
jgi:hypothetical protein